MCIIAVSARGQRQPTNEELINMFFANPHGAGYMTARNGKVKIRKGFMTLTEYVKALETENFTADDPVVYHFRISTQAGITPSMTHPFPLVHDIKDTRELDATCDIGLAHNGIISMTTNHADRDYSDTAHFIAEYANRLIRTPADLHDPAIMQMIEKLTASKWAIMDGTGYIATAGKFTEHDGILFSNDSFRPSRFTLAPVKVTRKPEKIYKPYRNKWDVWADDDWYDRF